MRAPVVAQQEHLYQHGAVRVIVMEPGRYSVVVRVVDSSEPMSLGARYNVRPEWLTPLPMKYFGGQVPK